MALQRPLSADQVTNGAIPLHSSMDYKLATSRRPAQAVGYPAQGRGADGDGGGTAGTSLAGVVAASVTNNHKCETPHPAVPKRRTVGSNSDPSPSSVSGQTLAPKGAGGKLLNGAEAEPDDPPIKLTNKPFKLATWNMCGQGTRQDPTSRRKIRFAEQLMVMEDIDILVLTETHTTSLPASCRVQVVEQTGLAAKAGMAVLVRAGAGWEAPHSEVIIPGYAVMVQLSHRVSRESFWILGVYGDVSKGESSLADFYDRLLRRLTTFVRRQAKTHWGGCFAIGDWNFVEYAKDRYPTAHANRAPTRILESFEKIRDLCAAEDISGAGPAPSLWTYSKMTHHGRAYSRLDRIYRPSLGWSSGVVTPMDTSWSDHRLVLATAFVRHPKIQKAAPARRLPELDLLRKAKKFWPGILELWKSFTEDSPVTLESWAAFKERVLEAGIREVTAMKKAGKKDWLSALKNKTLPPEEIMSTVTKANRQIWAKAPPPARTPHKWLVAIPAYEVAPKPSRHFIPSPASPWQAPTWKPVGQGARAPATNTTFGKPDGGRGVATLLQDRVLHFDESSKKKQEEMTRTHSSEWFKQSSNKELDERGSRASVSVEGLRRPTEDLARTDLEGMTAVARDYFFHLHTPEPDGQAREAAQAALLEKVRQQSLLRPDPERDAVEDGPFTREEMKALLSKMPNTAPGPDGITYGFWKELIRMLDRLQDDKKAPPRTFWDAFSELTTDIAARGSSRAGFKNANISLFYKKGDPTLVANYRPISSMNTDCKMYTNLINGRLAPWAMAKLHPDQKGFVPG